MGMACGAASPMHRRSQVVPVEQLTEHEAVHVMWHVELPVQLTLALGPTVAVRVDCAETLMLHDSAQSPEHVVWLEQSSVQLPAVPPQAVCENVQAPPELQLQVAPVHAAAAASTGPEVESPQEASTMQAAATST